MFENCVKNYLKKKDGCQMRQQTRRSAVWADLMKQCTSQFPKVYKCSYKYSLSNSNFNSKIIQNLDSSFQALSNYYKLRLFLKAYCLLQPFYVLHQLFSLVLNRILLSILAQQNLVLDQLFLSLSRSQSNSAKNYNFSIFSNSAKNYGRNTA